MTTSVVVGAGAAGLFAAITAAERGTGRVVLVEGEKKPGAKILVSGGGRCNVTNEVVAESDFHGGSRPAIRSVLRAFSAADARRFFDESGVALRSEPLGKLFPVSNRARDVLDALLARGRNAGVELLAGRRATAVDRRSGGFQVRLADGEKVEAERVVLATGGLSLPKSGSDGAGLDIARAFGHSIVSPVPALVPLLLDGSFHRELSGVSQPVELVLRCKGRAAAKVAGSMLWTHFGISGPAALDLSRHWERAHFEGEAVTVEANLLPGFDFEKAEKLFLDAARSSPSRGVTNFLAERLPARVAERVVGEAAFDSALRLGRLDREARRRVVHLLVAHDLPVVGDRGWSFAEVTAGGVALSEVDPRTMESRIVPGLHLVGEMLDVDGRLGGFNFQWAWSSGFVAGAAVAREDDPRGAALLT